jgi:geranylgeranylglycerol-phosphate geranylgeranyltransferase
MIAAIEILRPINGLMAVAAFVVGAALSGFPLAPVPLQLLVGAFVIFLQSGGGMVLNDYFDWEIDRINRPYRVIPSGRMTLDESVNYAAALFGVSLALSFAVLPILMTALVVFNAALSLVYSWKLKKTILGHIAVSWLTASVFVLAALMTGDVTYIGAVLFALVFFASMAREIAKGIEDYKGDKAAGARTLAVSVGMDVAGWLAVAFLFLTATIAPLPFVFKYVGTGYALVAAVAVALLAYAAYQIYNLKPAEAQKAIKWAMGLAVLALILGMLF